MDDKNFEYAKLIDYSDDEVTYARKKVAPAKKVKTEEFHNSTSDGNKKRGFFNVYTTFFALIILVGAVLEARPENTAFNATSSAGNRR